MSTTTADEIKPQLIKLQDYKKPSFLIKEINLEFDLFEDKTIVASELICKKNGNEDFLFLNGEELKLLSIHLDNRELNSSEYTVSSIGLTLHKLPEQFKLKIKTEIYPQNNKAFSGLYKTKNIFCTQMEAEGFRHVTFFMDRPDVLAKYTTTIRADKNKYPLLLSNGNLIDCLELEGGRHECTWHDPFPKPCYLFALVAGDLGVIKDTFTTKSKKKVELRLYVDKGNESRGHHAMECLKKSMKWDEEVFNREYDLSIYMVVAVDDFNMGAMENKGLNIFNSRFVLADLKSATDEEFIDIESVIGHEYFHNWSGNRVTCRDWFQLSLKEGLTVFRDQEFSADMNSRAVNRIQDVNKLRTLQFAEDAGPMAHPIRPQSYISIDNFYTLTVYEKGAEVIRMIYQILGRENFHKGMDLYFSTFDGQAVTTEDFVFCMQKASGIDLTSFQNWYHQAGTPEVSVNQSFDEKAQTITLRFSQKTIDPITKKINLPYHIPIKMGLLSADGTSLNLIDESNKDLGQQTTLQLKQSEQSFTFKNIKTKPIASLLREFTAPIKLSQELSPSDLLTLMSFDPDSFNRWEASQKIYLNELTSALKNPDQYKVNSALVAAMKKILLETEKNKALVAQLISLPAKNYFLQFCNPIDPQQIAKAYLAVNSQLATQLAPDLFFAYEKLVKQSTEDMSAAAQDTRSLKNTVLMWLGKTGTTQAYELAYKQFCEGQNMTDKLSAIEMLSHTDSNYKSLSLEKFRQDWKHDTLVMNKWFKVQALSQSPDVLNLIDQLTKVPEFDKTNPNKIYSLLSTFANFNLVGFHRTDGKAYEFLADWVIDIDSRNPQVSARVVSVFNQWKKFSSPYDANMQKQLQRILEQKSLSKNVYEITERALKN